MEWQVLYKMGTGYTIILHIHVCFVLPVGFEQILYILTIAPSVFSNVFYVFQVVDGVARIEYIYSRIMHLPIIYIYIPVIF